MRCPSRDAGTVGSTVGARRAAPSGRTCERRHRNRDSSANRPTDITPPDSRHDTSSRSRGHTATPRSPPVGQTAGDGSDRSTPRPTPSRRSADASSCSSTAARSRSATRPGRCGADPRPGARRPAPPLAVRRRPSTTPTLEVLASSTPDAAVGGGRRPRPARRRRPTPGGAHPPPLGRRRAARGHPRAQHVAASRSDWTLRVRVAADFAHVFDVKAGRSATDAALVDATATAGGSSADGADATTSDLRPTPPPDARRPRRRARWSWHLDVRRGERVGRHRHGRAGRRRRAGGPGVPVRRRRRPTRSRCAGWRVAGVSVPTRRVDRSAAVGRGRPGAGRHRRAADHRRRPPRPAVDRRRRAVVHDAVRPRLAADLVDDAAVRRRARRRRALDASPSCRAPSTTRWPRSSPARSSTSCAATAAAARSPLGSATTAPSTPRRCSSCSPPRRGAGARSAPSDLAGLGAGRRRRRSTGCSATATPTATGSSTTSAATRRGLVQPGLEGLVGRRHLRRRLAARRARSRSPRCRAMPTPRCSARPSSAAPMALAHDRRRAPSPRADALRDAFNEAFWDERGWFAIGLDGDGRRDRLADDQPGPRAVDRHRRRRALADRYLDRLMDPTMWTGWGLRTLAEHDGRLRPAQLPQRIGVAARHRASAPPAPPATAAGTSSTASSTARFDAAIAVRRPPARAVRRHRPRPTRRCPSPTRRRARRRRGRRPRSCCCSRTMLDLRPPDGGTASACTATTSPASPTSGSRACAVAVAATTVDVRDGRNGDDDLITWRQWTSTSPPRPRRRPVRAVRPAPGDRPRGAQRSAPGVARRHPRGRPRWPAGAMAVVGPGVDLRADRRVPARVLPGRRRRAARLDGVP